MFIIFGTTNNEKVNNKFEQLYHTYSKYLYSIGIHILRDEMLAADALQQCFLKIFLNIDKIDRIESKQTKSFVSIIMQNESLTIYRKYKNIADVTVPLEDELYIADETPNVDEILARAELRKEVGFYLDILSLEERQIIIFKYTMEYSHEEIARILNISSEAVRKRLSRAKRKLAVLITKNEREGTDGS